MVWSFLDKWSEFISVQSIFNYSIESFSLIPQYVQTTCISWESQWEKENDFKWVEDSWVSPFGWLVPLFHCGTVELWFLSVELWNYGTVELSLLRDDYLDQIQWIFGKLPNGGGVISDPKNFVAVFPEILGR